MTRTFARSPLLLAGVSAAQLLAVACSAPPAAPPSPASSTPIEAQVTHREPQLGVPTFVWLNAQPDPGADAKTVAGRV